MIVLVSHIEEKNRGMRERNEKKFVSSSILVGTGRYLLLGGAKKVHTDSQ
jgi:hypothetical protein